MNFYKCICLAFFLTSAIFASATDFVFEYHGTEQRSTRYIPEKVQQLASEALNNPFLESDFYRGKIDVVTDENDDLSYLVVLLFSSTGFGGERYKITFNADTVTSVIRDYDGKELTSELSAMREEDCECPDSTVEALFTNGIGYSGYYPKVGPSLDYAAALTKKQGLKTVLIGDAWTAVSSNDIKGWLKCPKLKIWGNIGHGIVGTIYPSFKSDDPGLDNTYFESLDGALKNKVLLWCTCLVHSEPMKSAMKKAGPYWWTAGDSVTIPATYPAKSQYGGEHIFMRWLDSVVVKGKEMGRIIDVLNPIYIKPGFDQKYGYSGYSEDKKEYYWKDVINGEETSIGSKGTNSEQLQDIQVVQKRGSIVITSHNPKTVHAQLFTVQGKKLEDSVVKLGKGQTVLPVSSSLSPGYYILELSTPERTFSYPLIRE